MPRAEIKLPGDNPYRECIQIIKQWCDSNLYDSMVVTLRVGGNLITEFLELRTEALDFCFENDWWEGEKDIYLVGFAPLSHLRVYGFDRHCVLTTEEWFTE